MGLANFTDILKKIKLGGDQMKTAVPDNDHNWRGATNNNAGYSET